MYLVFICSISYEFNARKTVLIGQKFGSNGVAIARFQQTKRFECVRLWIIQVQFLFELLVQGQESEILSGRRQGIKIQVLFLQNQGLQLQYPFTLEESLRIYALLPQ